VRPRILALPLIIGFSAAGGVDAQVAGYFDAGSGTMHMGSEASFGVVRLAPTLQLTTRSFLLDAEGDFAGHTEHGWQSNGHLTAAVRRTFFGRIETRFGVDGGASRTRWGRGAGGWLGHGQIQIADNIRGFAIKVGSGRRFASNGTQPISRMEAGGWSRLGRLDIGFWLKRTGLTVPGVEQVDRDGADTLTAGPGTKQRMLEDHYTDLEATVGWSRGNLALEAGAGRRFGKAVRFTSWHVRALYQVTSRVALVASSGQFPVDVVSGLPSGGFTTLSMRFNLRNEPAPVRQSSSPIALRRAFSASSARDGTHLIAIRVPQASVVEVMGDFTDWTPVLLVPGEQDEWRLRMRIAPGLHEVNLRIDGGPWVVPAGLASMDDGLGGKVGVFTIE
jgi:hypothetical protein